VIEVTNLNDSGPGSLRAAIEANGARIVIFRIGGTIELRSELSITNPYITIAGQTAPGGGITLRNHPSNNDGPLAINTHDVIIRYIRSRAGPSLEESSNLDGLEIKGDNIIIDHCSISWATDENIAIYGRNITIQWSITSEGLYDSTHEKGPHSMGMAIRVSRDLSAHHNLMAHNNARNPRIAPHGFGVVDVVNNVIYDGGGSVVSDDYARVPVNYVGNYHLCAGASICAGKGHYISASDPIGDGYEFFVLGNITGDRPGDDMDEALAVSSGNRRWIVPTRHDAPLVTTTSAFEAYDQVLANAGATIGLDSQENSCWRRDTVDERIVNDVINGTGSIIDDPSEVGGWPQLAAGTPPADTDHDGMPDNWENLYGLNPNDPSDGSGDANGDGYTNIEEFLNELVTGTAPADGSGVADRDGYTNAEEFLSGTTEPTAEIILFLPFIVKDFRMSAGPMPRCK
jgi:hypothetical protein